MGLPVRTSPIRDKRNTVRPSSFFLTFLAGKQGYLYVVVVAAAANLLNTSIALSILVLSLIPFFFFLAYVLGDSLGQVPKYREVLTYLWVSTNPSRYALVLVYARRMRRMCQCVNIVQKLLLLLLFYKHKRDWSLQHTHTERTGLGWNNKYGLVLRRGQMFGRENPGFFLFGQRNKLGNFLLNRL